MAGGHSGALRGFGADVDRGRRFFISVTAGGERRCADGAVDQPSLSDVGICGGDGNRIRDRVHVALYGGKERRRSDAPQALRFGEGGPGTWLVPKVRNAGGYRPLAAASAASVQDLCSVGGGV